MKTETNNIIRKIQDLECEWRNPKTTSERIEAIKLEIAALEKEYKKVNK
jgi:hypothetical protein